MRLERIGGRMPAAHEHGTSKALAITWLHSTAAESISLRACIAPLVCFSRTTWPGVGGAKAVKITSTPRALSMRAASLLWEALGARCNRLEPLVREQGMFRVTASKKVEPHAWCPKCVSICRDGDHGTLRESVRRR